MRGNATHRSEIKLSRYGNKARSLSFGVNYNRKCMTQFAAMLGEAIYHDPSLFQFEFRLILVKL